MGKIVVDWFVLIHNIIPFSAAQLFLIVLVYFSLVREKISKEYIFYAIFLVSFVFYLAATLINILPIQAVAVYTHYISSFILFSIGFPSLVVALFVQSRIYLSRYFSWSLFGLGSLWSVFYFITADYRTNKVNVLAAAGNEGAVADWVNFANVFYAQAFVIVVMLVLPGVYLLYRVPATANKTYIYGMLSLAGFAVIGSLSQQWAVYYAGSCICALAWARAMFTDIRALSEQVKEHYAHEKNLSLAQFASRSGNISIADLYPESLDESYPFREREELIEAIKTSSCGLIEPRAQAMVTALHQFANQNDHVFKARIREVLYLLVDTCVYQGGDARTLIVRLEQKGQEIEECEGLEAVSALLLGECLYLAQAMTAPARASGVDALVERTKSCVLANYHKADLCIDSIAALVGVSRSHVMKSFKAKYGITLTQYLNEVRINKAKSYLLQHSVTDTAYQAGFKSASYFATSFRKHTGLTPKQFQQQARGDSE